MFSRADAYEQFMGRWSRLLAPGLIRFSDLHDGDAVLDVGCGTGALSFAVRDATTTTRITGVDASPEYVAHATNASTDARVHFLVGDAAKLSFPNAEFDQTLSLLVLNFVPDAEGAIREWMRVTKPGGLVTAAVWDYGEGMQMLRMFWDEATAFDPTMRPRDEAHMRLCRRGDLGALWNRAGLTKVVEEPLTMTMHFGSFDAYWAPFLLGQGPAGAYAASLPPPDQAELSERLRRRLYGTSPERPIDIQGRAWAVRGTVPD